MRRGRRLQVLGLSGAPLVPPPPAHLSNSISDVTNYVCQQIPCTPDDVYLDVDSDAALSMLRHVTAVISIAPLCLVPAEGADAAWGVQSVRDLEALMHDNLRATWPFPVPPAWRVYDGFQPLLGVIRTLRRVNEARLLVYCSETLSPVKSETHTPETESTKLKPEAPCPQT